MYVVSSPGYGLVLVSEGTSGIIHAAEGCSMSSVLPEDIGKDTALRLIQEIVTVSNTLIIIMIIINLHSNRVDVWIVYVKLFHYYLWFLGIMMFQKLDWDILRHTR